MTFKTLFLYNNDKVNITDYEILFFGVYEMKQYTDIKGKLWELVREYEVSNSDLYKINIQGMIEALFWTLNENVETDLKLKIENII